MLQKFIKSTREQAVITKNAKHKKTSFPKEQVENTDLYKPVLNKIMTTQEQCVKYNFVAPNLFRQININQMFGKIQMTLTIKTTVSNNRINLTSK